MKRQEKILGYVLLAISAFFYLMTFRLPEEARVYPLFVTTLLFILSLLHLVLTIRKPDDQFKVLKTLTSEQKKRGLLVVVASAFYIVVLNKIGYVVSTLIYMGLILYKLDVDKKKVAIISVVFTALVYALFSRLLNVPLPKGMLI